MTLASGDVLVYDGNNWVNSSYTSYTKVVLSRPGPPTQSNGLLNLGDGPFDGASTGHFVGSGNGTVLAINSVSTYLGRLCEFQVGGTEMFWVGSGGMCWVVNFTHSGSLLGFFGTTATTKQTASGSRGGNAALQSLLTCLANYGLITDSTSA